MQLPPDKTPDLLVETGEPEDVVSLGPVPGIWIALATFVPTFLAIVFGIPYLAGLPMASRFPAGLQGTIAPIVSLLAPEQGFVEAPPPEPAPMMPSEILTRRVAGQGDEPARLPSRPTRETLGPAEVAATIPAISPPALPPPRPQAETKAAEPKGSAAIAPKEHVWVRGVAFSDWDSAERLAASIERQGHAAKVRREEAAATPWVVWISQHPRERQK